jgi:hypothetical protein
MADATMIEANGTAVDSTSDLFSSNFIVTSRYRLTYNFVL